MSSKAKVLYVGMTNNLARRVYEHKNKINIGFTAKYNVNRLVYFEETEDEIKAMKREKQIKGWLRKKKIKLIETTNPNWDDLSTPWMDSILGKPEIAENEYLGDSSPSGSCRTPQNYKRINNESLKNITRIF
ncbi:MAG: GIY-YIG nuclease family protein [Ignavibacteriales bacterium]|nr:GIY-YIG nuclease family protein [Ignavibacteriales bacterium]